MSVSVIIATHSRPHLLPEAVESARNAGTDVEAIVVDDASTDATAEVCSKLEGIKYIRLDRNQGVAGARNVGILASTGEFITFHDDDDLRFPGSLDRQTELLKRHPDAGMAYAQVIIGDENCIPTEVIEPKQLQSGDLFWELLSGYFIPYLSVVFRRECLYRVGLLQGGARGYDDWDLWVRIAELYPVLAADEPVGIWRSSTPGSGQGSSSRADHLGGVVEHQLKLFTLPRAAAAPASKRSEARRRLLNWTSDLLIWDAATWLPRGWKEHARHGLLTALRIHPTRAFRLWTLGLLLQSVLPDFRSTKTGDPA